MDYKLILASNSPRRRELLAGLELNFEVRLIDNIDESYPDTLRGEAIPRHIAMAKAKAYMPTLASDELLITADTVVIVDGEVLGKPHTDSEACEMLARLAGRTHHVMTGVALTTTTSQRVFVSVTEVDFAPLTTAEIEHYVAVHHPLDKAGAYGIQEWIGYVGVTGLRGSYFNVMGLPVQRLYTELKSFFNNDEKS